MGKLARAGIAAAFTTILVLEGIALAGWWGNLQRSSRTDAPPTAIRSGVKAVEQAVATLPARIGEQLRHQPPETVHARAQEQYYAELRSKVRWVPTRIGDTALVTPDLESRLLLARSAAEKARLDEVGLGPRDVYGIINAETSWLPRMGASKNGTPNLGIAQFEPATARALGMRNPHDPVEAIHVAAVHMKEAARWSENRIAGLNLSHLERGIKLREGVSIYYNLSSRGRSVWNGRNTSRLPRETQLHIYNARIGAMHADFLEAQMLASRFASLRGRTVVTALDIRG
ncbi:MAG: transglycosylase SLT domain-containing protein [Pseudomonadota bacterium]